MNKLTDFLNFRKILSTNECLDITAVIGKYDNIEKFLYSQVTVQVVYDEETNEYFVGSTFDTIRRHKELFSGTSSHNWGEGRNSIYLHVFYVSTLDGSLLDKNKIQDIIDSYMNSCSLIHLFKQKTN